MANDIEVGRLTLPVDTGGIKDLKKELGDLKEGFPTVGGLVDKFVDSLKNIFGGAGLAAVAVGGLAGGLAKMVESTIEAETRMLELSESVGIPIEKFQPFSQAMELSGVTSEKLVSSLTKLSSTIAGALTDPTGKAADAFHQLGIKQKELAEGDVEKIMKDAAKGLDQYADSAQKTAIARELFGKQGPAIVAAMKDEAEYEAMAAATQKDYGTAITDSDAHAAKYFGATLKLGMTMFDGLAMSVTKSLLPGLQALVNAFADSGKAGGAMHEVLEGLGTILVYTGKTLITALEIPIAAVGTAFKEAATVISYSMEMIDEVSHGHFAEVKKSFNSMSDELKKTSDDFTASQDKILGALWKTADGAEKVGKAHQEGTKDAKAYSDALKKAAEADTAGYDRQVKLIGEINNALKQQTNLTKELDAEKIKGKSAYDAQNQALAYSLDLDKKASDDAKNQASLQETITKMHDQTTAAINKENEAITATKQDSILINQQAALTKTYQADIAANAKTFEADQATRLANEQKITAAYQAENAELIKEQANYTNLTTGATGFYTGLQKGFSQTTQDLSNMNDFGQKFASTLTNDVTKAFTDMGTKGAASFSQLMASMLTFIEQYIVKLLIAQAIQASMGMLSGGISNVSSMIGGYTSTSGAANVSMLSSAQGNVFADGGIVSAPTTFNMGLMGEAGPEAIMPLTRDSSGTLGVKSAGGGAGTTTHYNPININVHSNQDPHEIAAQTKKLFNTAQLVSKKTMTEQQRTGGILNQPRTAFNRS